MTQNWSQTCVSEYTKLLSLKIASQEKELKETRGRFVVGNQSFDFDK
jgi:hypothetical protein